MDSLTQIVLGAGVGEAVLGKKIGNKAMLWGAIGGTIPDLDVVSQFFADEFIALSWHRGFSHSMIFFILVSPLLAWLMGKIYRKKPEATFKEWTIFFFMVTFTHALLDCFTSWGTQIFWPFPWRVRFNNIFVADFLYTLPFLACVIWCMFYDRKSKKRRKINNAGLIISSAYMVFTLGSKYVGYQDVKADLERRGVEYTNLSTRPTPLNSILWSATLETETDYMVGYKSILDKADSVQWNYIPKNWELLEPYEDDETVQLLLFLTQGNYAALPMEDGVRLLDLRFGQPEGAGSDDERFVFSYYIRNTENGVEITPAETPEPTPEEASESLNFLWERLKGI
ncbi:MAG: metal-dependent hydrolase [Bacteroidota bacterium]